MPLNEYNPATTLIGPEAEDPLKAKIDYQNRNGMKYETIRDLPSGQNVTILAVARDAAMSAEQYFAMLEELKANYGVVAMQTCFNVDVPSYGDDYHKSLYLTAHLRIDPKHGSTAGDGE